VSPPRERTGGPGSARPTAPPGDGTHRHGMWPMGMGRGGGGGEGQEGVASSSWDHLAPQCMPRNEKVRRVRQDPQSDLREPNLTSEINYFKDTAIIIQRKIKSRIHLPKNPQTLCHNKHVEDWGGGRTRSGRPFGRSKWMTLRRIWTGKGHGWSATRSTSHAPIPFAPTRGPTCWNHFVPLQIYLHGYCQALTDFLQKHSEPPQKNQHRNPSALGKNNKTQPPDT